MKTAVIYYSRTGNSKKIAESVAAALQTKATDIKLKPVINEVDVLFIVGGIYGGASSPDLKAFVEDIKKNHVNKVALITSCLSKKQRQNMIRDILIRNKIEVVPEEFICRGNLLFIGFGHPNKDDINAAICFAQKVISENT